MDINYIIFVVLLVVGLTLVALWAAHYDKMHSTK